MSKEKISKEKEVYQEMLPRLEMLESEYKTTMRFLKSGAARLQVPRDVAKNYLPNQLVSVVINGSIGPIVVV